MCTSKLLQSCLLRIFQKPTDMSCKTRLDVAKRIIQKDHYTIEIGINQADTAANFMKEMLGTDSDWASGLGTNFEQSLKAKYDLNSRSKRAW